MMLLLLLTLLWWWYVARRWAVWQWAGLGAGLLSSSWAEVLVPGCSQGWPGMLSSSIRSQGHTCSQTCINLINITSSMNNYSYQLQNGQSYGNMDEFGIWQTGNKDVVLIRYYIPQWMFSVCCSASKSSIRRFVITEKAPTRAFSWLKAPTSAFTFKTLLTLSCRE